MKHKQKYFLRNLISKLLIITLLSTNLIFPPTQTTQTLASDNLYTITVYTGKMKFSYSDGSSELKPAIWNINSSTDRKYTEVSHYYSDPTYTELNPQHSFCSNTSTCTCVDCDCDQYDYNDYICTCNDDSCESSVSLLQSIILKENKYVTSFKYEVLTIKNVPLINILSYDSTSNTYKDMYGNVVLAVNNSSISYFPGVSNDFYYPTGIELYACLCDDCSYYYSTKSYSNGISEKSYFVGHTTKPKRSCDSNTSDFNSLTYTFYGSNISVTSDCKQAHSYTFDDSHKTVISSGNVSVNSLSLSSLYSSNATIDYIDTLDEISLGYTKTSDSGSSGSTGGGTSTIDVESVSLSPTTLSGTVGQQLQITPTITPTNATNTNLIWTTSDSSVATVNNGVVSCNKAGQVTITATSNNGKSATCSVTVTNKPTSTNSPSSFSLEPSFITVPSGTSITFNIANALDSDGYPTNNSSYTWKVNDITKSTSGSSYTTSFTSASTATFKISATNNGITKYATVVVTPPTVNATGISISPTNQTLTVGDTLAMTATITPSTTTDKTVTWSSSDPTVATVSNGIVTALKAGQTMISANTGTVGAGTTIKVVDKTIPVEKLTLNNYNLTLPKGQTSQLTATKYPVNANSGTNITYSTSNSSIASVNSSTGLITANGAGTAVITATSGSGATAQCTITVPDTTVPVTSIALNTTTKNMIIGSTFTPTVTYSPLNANSGKSISSWTSSDSTIATVNSSGLITAKSAGTATIMATSANGYTASLTVNVQSNTINATSLSLNNTAKTLKLGESLTLTATVLPSAANKGTNLTWSVSDDNVSLSTTSGNSTKVTANKIGTSTVRVVNDNGLSSSCIITIEDSAIPVTSISLNTTQETLNINQTLQLSTLVTPTNATYGTAISYSSSNNGIAVVSSSGLITAKSAGTATITAKSANGQVAQCVITVRSSDIDVTSILMSTSSKVLNVGNTFNLTATAFPLNANINKTLTWTSSEPSVASVNQSGQVSALSPGTTTITVQNNSGIYATAQVQVQSNVIEVQQINLNKTSETLMEGNTTDLTVSYYPSNANSGNSVTFNSSNSSVASVTSTGKITAISEGVATITATNSQGLSAQCVINVTSSKIPVTSLVLSTGDLTLNKGQTFNLSATVYPENATNKNVAFSSSNPTVATINSSGSISTLAKGSTVISAVTEDGQKTATFNLTVTEKLTKFNFVKDLYKFNGLNQTEQLQLNIEPLTSKPNIINYTSSNTNVCMIDKNGIITTTGSGSAVITASTPDGQYTTTTKVTVYVPVSSIAFSEDTLTIPVGKTFATSVNIIPTSATNSNLTYTSANSKVVAVDSKGNLIGLQPGQTTITVTSQDNTSLTDTLIVTVTQEVTSVELSKKDIIINEGATLDLTAYIQPTNTTDTNIDWHISDTSIVRFTNTPDNNKTVQLIALKEGTTVISVQAGNYQATTSITVLPKITSISISESEVTLDLEDQPTYKLTTTFEPYNCFNSNIIYTTSNKDVVKVSSDGTLTAVAVGVATITAKSDYDNLILDTCRVVVKQPITSVGLNATSLTLQPGDYFQLESNLNDGLTGSITYTSSNPFSVYVDQSTGLLTALEDGQAIITATCGKVSASCYVRVLTPVEDLTFTFSNNIIKRDGNDIWIYEEASGGLPVQITASIYPQTSSVKTLTLLVPQTIDQDVEDLKLHTSVVSIPDTKTSTLQLVTTVNPDCKGTATLTYQYDTNKTKTLTIHVVRKVEGINLIDTEVTTDNLKYNTISKEWSQKTLNLDYIFTPERPTNENLIWTSSDTTIATVDRLTGLITPLKAGSAIITVTTEDGNYTDTCLLTVTQPVTGIEATINDLQSDTIPSINNPKPYNDISTGIIQVAMGYEYQITAFTIPEDAKDKTILYTSSQPDILTVSDTGLITPVSTGSSTITVSTVGTPVYTKTFNITITQPVLAFNIDLEDNLILEVGENLTIPYLINPETATYKNVSWSSSDDTIAQFNVNSNTLKALKAGEVTVKGITENGNLTDTYTFSVKEPLTAITITNKISSFNAGDTYQLETSLTPKDVRDASLIFTSLNPTIVSVSETGLLTALKRGTSDIVVSSKANPLIVDTFNIEVIQLANSILIEEVEPIAVGATYQLTATVSPEDTNNNDLIFESSNPEVLTISETGLLTALTKGSSNITVVSKSNPAVSETIIVTTYIVPTSLTIQNLPDTIDRTNVASLTLIATTEPEGSEVTDLIWASSNPDVAYINQQGILTIIGNGETTISATSPTYELIDQRTVKILTTATSFTIERPLKLYDDTAYTWVFNLIPVDASEDVEYTLDINGIVYPFNKTSFNYILPIQSAGEHQFKASLYLTGGSEPLHTVAFNYTVLSRAEQTNTSVDDITLSPDLTNTGIELDFNRETGSINIMLPSNKEFNSSDLILTLPENVKSEVKQKEDGSYILEITSPDGSTTKEYPIIVSKKQPQETDTTITPSEDVKIDDTNSSVEIIIPSGSTFSPDKDLNLTLPTGAKSEVIKNEDNTYTLIITSPDGSVKKEYTLNIKETASNNTNIKSFSINNIQGTINDTLISVELPLGTDTAHLTYDLILESPKAAYLLDIPNKTIIVTAEDLTQKIYTFNITCITEDPTINYIEVKGRFATLIFNTYKVTNASPTDYILIMPNDPTATYIKTIKEETALYIIYNIEVTSKTQTKNYELLIVYSEPNQDYRPPVSDKDDTINKDDNNIDNSDYDSDDSSDDNSDDLSSNSNNNSSSNNSNNSNSSSSPNSSNSQSNNDSSSKSNDNNSQFNPNITTSKDTISVIESNTNITISDTIQGVQDKDSNLIIVSKKDLETIKQNPQKFRDLILDKTNNILTDKNNNTLITVEDYLSDTVKELIPIGPDDKEGFKYTIQETTTGGFTLIIPESAPSNALVNPNITYNQATGKYIIITELLGTIEVSPKIVQTMKLTIGSNIGYINDEATYIQDTAMYIDDTVYLPMRLVLEYLGAKVDWSQETSTASFKKGNLTIKINTVDMPERYTVVNERIYTTATEMINLFNLSTSISTDTDLNIVEVLKEITTSNNGTILTNNIINQSKTPATASSTL